jgi:hypothetical protein
MREKGCGLPTSLSSGFARVGTLQSGFQARQAFTGSPWTCDGLHRKGFATSTLRREAPRDDRPSRAGRDRDCGPCCGADDSARDFADRVAC